MQKKVVNILVGILLALIIGFHIHILFFKKPIIEEKTPTEFIEKIDSLEYIIDSISIEKEKINEKIDTVYFKIYKNNLKYEETRDIIVNNNVDEDYLFFSKYIEYYKSRYDSINNF